MPRFKLYIEYDGTRYGGWQKQHNSKTIQGTLLKAAEKIFNTSKLDIQGSGRTDGGVHAICQIAHLEVNTAVKPEIIKMKFNDELPFDINILAVERAGRNFHARHDALSRSYLYRISRRRTAFGKNYVWWIKDKLDFAKMEAASKEFLGMKDFSSFSDNDKKAKSTKVMVEDIKLKEEGDLIIVKITASHFLWKMVRRIVGILVEAGRGNISTKDIRNFLNNYSNVPAKYTAPPSGLFLEQVSYKNENITLKLQPFVIHTDMNIRK